MSLSQQLAKFRQSTRVCDVLRCEARSASLEDSVLQDVEAGGAVSVGVDHDRDASILRGCGMSVVQIESARMCVDLQQDSVISGGCKNIVE